MNAPQDNRQNNSDRNQKDEKPEMDLGKLVDRQADVAADQGEQTESLQSDAAKAPQHPVEAPATSYPDQGSSIADLADQARARSRSNK